MTNKQVRLADVASMVDGSLSGAPDLVITGFGPLDSAGTGQLSFLVKSAMHELLGRSGASAFLVPEDFPDCDKPVIRVRDPYLAAAIVQNFMLTVPFIAGGVSNRAVIGDDCAIPAEVTIGPCAVLGNRVKLGERVEIGAGAVIGDDVVIGDDCRIKANVTVEPRCELGHRVVVHPGTVIGSDGYGYATDRQGQHIKRPQLGIVRIGDDVEIGANVCIDRATFGVTWIKSGTKIDNLVQIAHNVVIGENSLIVAQVGLSGSTTLGRNVVFAGKASSSGHQTIGDRTMVAGKAAVHGDHPAGSMLAGTPAIDAKQWFKATTVFGKLPDLAREVRRLRKELDRLGNKDGSK